MSSFDTTTGTLVLTWGCITGWQAPDKEGLSGVLDLRSPLILKEGDTESEVKLVRFGDKVFTPASSSYNSKISEFYCDIISLVNEKLFQGNTSITKVEVGGSADTLSQYFVSGCTSLSSLKLNFPNLLKIEGDCFNNTKLSNMDIATIVTPGVTNVAWYACQFSWMRGDIALTNVVTLGGGAFKNASLYKVSLDGPLTTLQQNVFQHTNNGTITNVVLGLTNLTTVAADAFNGQTKIRRVELVSAFSDMSLITNVVRYANNSGPITGLRIYVSKKQWEPSDNQKYDASENPTGFFSDITDTEKAALDDETKKNVIGVLVKYGTRKGLFIHKASKYDKPTGFAISIR